MFSTLYLHIGTPKTGTTAIQQFMFSNRNTLAKYGCFVPDYKMNYPEIGNYRNAHWLIPKFRDEKSYSHNMNTLKKIAKKYKTIYMSDESIWNHCGFRPSFWGELKRDLANIGIELKIIVYLRRQDIYLYSFWAELVRRGKVQSSNIRQYRAAKPLVMRHLNYYKYIKNGIMPEVELSNISIGIYERCRFVGEYGLLEDFLGRVNNMKLTDDLTLPQRNVNEGLRDVILEVRANLNHIEEFQKHPEYINYLLLKVQKRFKEEGRLRDRNTFFLNNREHFMRKFSNSNSKLATNFLGRKDGILFEDMQVEESEIPNFSNEEIVLACGYLIQEIQKDYLKKLGKDAVKRVLKRK